jgi:nucleotide-binding universal stress UspA family protein
MNTGSSKSPHINAGGRVLAAIDASVYTESVCRHAAWAAARLAAPLEFVHVIDPVEQTAPVDLSGNLALGEQETLLLELSALDEKRSKLAQERGRLLLQQARQFAASAGAEAADVRLRHGGLSDTLLELEADVRLFVIGKRGEHADFATGHLGSEVERMVRAVHRPLLVASRGFRPVRRVLMAFDGSATTRKGIEMVAASPLFRGLEVHVVTVGDGEGRRALEWAGQTLSANGFAPVSRAVQGEPEEAISAYVRDHAIDLLVMGAYGHSRIRQLIVGSTTTAMLRSCQVPVLLLR